MPSSAACTSSSSWHGTRDGPDAPTRHLVSCRMHLLLAVQGCRLCNPAFSISWRASPLRELQLGSARAARARGACMCVPLPQPLPGWQLRRSRCLLWSPATAGTSVKGCSSNSDCSKAVTSSRHHNGPRRLTVKVSHPRLPAVVSLFWCWPEAVPVLGWNVSQNFTSSYIPATLAHLSRAPLKNVCRVRLVESSLGYLAAGLPARAPRPVLCPYLMSALGSCLHVRMPLDALK